MYKRVILIILITILNIGFSIPSYGASRDYYYNRDYGWKIEIGPGFKMDDSSAPRTVAFSVGNGGLVTIESGLPSEFFWDSDMAAGSIMRVMGFAAGDVQIRSIESGDGETGLFHEDIYYRVETGEEELFGFLRMYSGPNGIILCYRDGAKGFHRNIDKVQDFAEMLYFPSLDEMFSDGDFEQVEFTNPVYGYRVSYPSILINDEVWSYVSLSFIYETVIDIYGETKLEPDVENVILDAKQQMLESLEGFAYEIIDEREGTIDGGYPFVDIKVNDNDTTPWVKRARIYALPKTVIRLEYYCPAEQFENRDAIFDGVVETFEYDAEWITEELGDYYTIPMEELYEYGEFEWVEYEDEQYGFTMDVPDFLEWEIADNVIFFNYDYGSIITVVTDEYADLSGRGAISASEEIVEMEFALSWEYTRSGDTAGSTPEGLPYIDFHLNDNDPEGSWIKHVRIISRDNITVRIEMYRPEDKSELSDKLFNDVVESFKFSD